MGDLVSTCKDSSVISKHIEMSFQQLLYMNKHKKAGEEERVALPVKCLPPFHIFEG